MYLYITKKATCPDHSLTHSLSHLCRIINPINLPSYIPLSFLHTYDHDKQNQKPLSHVINNQPGTQAMASKYV